ncbi:MAG: SGNH/GDSL hydrolase family protein [Kiritimatiellae bacterium]|nr:SGNH/GDSL hydrolase family protein [Kiritimatiellia bacterium]
MLRKTLFALVLGLGLAIIIVAFAVKDRRPVLVCLGDSLTSCGGPNGHYSDYLQRELPDIRVINSGIGGDTLEGAWARFERDVLRYKPRAVLIALGANDFWQNSREVSEMRQDLENMIIELQARNCRVVVADCFGDRDLWNEVSTEFSPRRNKLAADIGAMQTELCRKYGCVYVPNLQLDIKPNRLPPYWDETDHPSPKGNEQVAMRLLPAIRKAWEQ